MHLGKRGRNENPHILARAAKSLRESKAAPKGVAIGILVAEDQDLLVGIDEFLDLVVDIGGPVCGSYDFSSAASWAAASL